jgi:hypothetical protein
MRLLQTGCVHVVRYCCYLDVYTTCTRKSVRYDTRLLVNTSNALQVTLCMYRDRVQLRTARPWYRYFADLANVFDLLLQGLVLVCIGFWFKHIASPLRRTFSVKAPCEATQPVLPEAYGAATCFVDMFAYASNYAFFITFAGVIGLLMALKFFKFFSLSKRMNTLWLTLAKAAEALIVFGFGFSLLVSGFAFMGTQ